MFYSRTAAASNCPKARQQGIILLESPLWFKRFYCSPIGIDVLSNWKWFGMLTHPPEFGVLRYDARDGKDIRIIVSSLSRRITYLSCLQQKSVLRVWRCPTHFLSLVFPVCSRDQTQPVIDA